MCRCLAELELEAGSEGGDFDYSMNEGGLEVAQDLKNSSWRAGSMTAAQFPIINMAGGRPSLVQGTCPVSPALHLWCVD